MIKKIRVSLCKIAAEGSLFPACKWFFFSGGGRCFFLSSHYAGSILTWWTLKHYAGLDLDVVNPKPAGAGSKHYSGLWLLGSARACGAPLARACGARCAPRRASAASPPTTLGFVTLKPTI